MIHSKQHRGCSIQDPGTRGYRWWKTADFSHSARCAPTAEGKNSAVPGHLEKVRAARAVQVVPFGPMLCSAVFCGVRHSFRIFSRGAEFRRRCTDPLPIGAGGGADGIGGRTLPSEAAGLAFDFDPHNALPSPQMPDTRKPPWHTPET